MKNISKNNKLAILGTISFLVSLGFEQLGFDALQLIALFGFGFCFGKIFNKEEILNK